MPCAKADTLFSKSQLKVDFEKNPALPVAKFPFFVLVKDKIFLKCYNTQEPCNTLLSIFLPIICQVVAYRELKMRENFKLLILRVVVVVYEKWSLTRGSKYSNFTWKLLVCWKTYWSLRRAQAGRLLVSRAIRAPHTAVEYWIELHRLT